ncbi:MAG: DNA-binding transcriptional regulator [Mogibacterium sp.]|nr:DNA-binding transcriptional regulator [Mogibacterium sp.]
MNKKDKELESNFYKAVLSLENEKECKAFFDDVCTIKEVHDLSYRLEVARLLTEGKVFNEISKETGTSTATISRVNKCINYGPGGYRIVLQRVFGIKKKD